MDTMKAGPVAVVVPPGEGRTTWIGGHPVTHKLTREQTGGAFSFFEASVPPGDCPPLHIHREMDETFYVLDGTFEFTICDRVVTGRSGYCVHVPRGARHTYRNVGTAWGRLVTIGTPGGIEDFYIDVSGVDLEDPALCDRMRVISERHAIDFVEPEEEPVIA